MAIVTVLRARKDPGKKKKARMNTKGRKWTMRRKRK
jgi:hypothetical protein